jgi:transcriptional regulator
MELLKAIKEKENNKISLADISNNKIAVGIQTEEDFYYFYDKLISLSDKNEIHLGRDVWNLYMIEEHKSISAEIMKKDGILYIDIYNKNLCGFSEGKYYIEGEYTLMLFKDLNIDYTYEKEYGIWKS